MDNAPIQISLDANKLIDRLKLQVSELNSKCIEYEVFISQQHETIQKLEAAMEAKDKELNVANNVSTAPMAADVAPLAKRKVGKE